MFKLFSDWAKMEVLGSFNGPLILTCNFRGGGGSITPPPGFRC